MEAKQHRSNVTLTPLMPYYRADAEHLPNGFDDSIFPDGLEAVPKCAAILRANQYMIYHCDYLIVYDVGCIGIMRKLVADARKIERLHIKNIVLVPE